MVLLGYFKDYDDDDDDDDDDELADSKTLKIPLILFFRRQPFIHLFWYTM